MKKKLEKVLSVFLALNFFIGYLAPLTPALGVEPGQPDTIFFEATPMQATREPATKTKIFAIAGNLFSADSKVSVQKVSLVSLDTGTILQEVKVERSLEPVFSPEVLVQLKNYGQTSPNTETLKTLLRLKEAQTDVEYQMQSDEEKQVKLVLDPALIAPDKEIYVVADAGNAIVEYNENNNQMKSSPPVISMAEPQAKDYLRSESITLSYSATDTAGIYSLVAKLNETTVTSGQTVDLFFKPLGKHTFRAEALSNLGEKTTLIIKFRVIATTSSTKSDIQRCLALGWIDSAGLANSLIQKLNAVESSIAKGNTKTALNQLNALKNEIEAQRGKHITEKAAKTLLEDVDFLMESMQS